MRCSGIRRVLQIIKVNKVRPIQTLTQWEDIRTLVKCKRKVIVIPKEIHPFFKVYPMTISNNEKFDHYTASA